MLDELEIVKDILDDCENLEYKLMGNGFSQKFTIQIDISKSVIDSELKKFIDHSKFFDVNKKSYCEYDFSYSIIRRIEKLTNFKYLYFAFGTYKRTGGNPNIVFIDTSLLYLTFHNTIYPKPTF